MMKTMEESWGRFLPRALVLGVILAASVFVAIRAARAQEGEAGGRTRTALTIAGTLTLPAGVTQPHLTFTFYRGARNAMNAACGPITNATVTYDVGSRAFTAEVPIDTCPGLFNGESVWATTTVYERNGGAMLLTVERSSVNPVPYARYADQVGVSNDCPAGYERDVSAMGITLCVRTIAGGRDEMVKVGTGASAFWVDRYEASVFNSAGVQFGTNSANYAPGLAPNGQWGDGMRNTLLAVARRSIQPSRWITWFQAHAVCRSAGKQLITRTAWFAAADGLVAIDPDAGLDGAGSGETRCNTASSSTRATGAGVGCASTWGAQDMIGNLWEWSDEWYAGAGHAERTMSFGQDSIGDAGPPRAPNARWPTGYGDDGTGNVNSYVDYPQGFGIPAAALRGGDFRVGTVAGVFLMALDHAPTVASGVLGFRCVIPR